MTVVQSVCCVRLFATPWPQHVSLPCHSPCPGDFSNSCPLSQWCHPTISSSVTPFFSHAHSFPALIMMLLRESPSMTFHQGWDMPSSWVPTKCPTQSSPSLPFPPHAQPPRTTVAPALATPGFWLLLRGIVPFHSSMPLQSHGLCAECLLQNFPLRKLTQELNHTFLQLEVSGYLDIDSKLMSPFL